MELQLPPTDGVDQASRLSPITPTDHAGYLWIVTILGSIYTCLFCLLRAHIKWGIYEWDDLLLATATLTHLGQSIAIFHGLSFGLGKANSITEERYWTVTGQSFFVSEILVVAAIYLAKCSVVAMMLRLWTLAADFKRAIFCCGVMAFNVVCGLVTIVTLAVDCDGHATLTDRDSNSCPSQYARWQVTTALDITTDITLCLLPIALTWSLNMPAAMKAQVGLAFSFRLFAVPASIIHLVYLKPYLQGSLPEPQLAVAKPLSFQQVMATVSLVTATIPNMKTFMRSFNGTLGFHAGTGSYGGAGSNTRGSSSRSAGGHELQTIGRISTRAGRKTTTTTTTTTSRDWVGGQPDDGTGYGTTNSSSRLALRPDGAGHDIKIFTSAPDDASILTSDGHSLTKVGSREMMIKKKVEWNIERA